MRRFLLSVLLIGTMQLANAQADGSYMKEYNRNSLTILLVDGGKYSSDLKEAMSTVTVPEKFDNNMLGKRILPPASSSDEVRLKLESMDIPKDIFSKWFSRTDDGRFSMSVIHERGLYNATDADVHAASATKRGLDKLQDAGEKLIKQSYVMVVCFGDIKTMNQIYDEIDAKNRNISKTFGTKFTPVERDRNGYRGEAAGFLFRLSNVSEAMNDFYSNMWIFDDDAPETVAAKRQKFNDAQFHLAYVTSATASVDASQSNYVPQKSRQELFDILLNSSVDMLINGFENKVEQWKVRTTLYSTFPLRAKIGTKENLHVEDRYFVYEYQMDKNGQVEPTRRGVIRAKKVINNSHVADGGGNDNLRQTTSKFYQIAGHKLEPGMFLEQANDYGMGVSFGYAAGALSGAYLSLEGLVGQYVGLTQVKAILGGHVGGGNYDMKQAPNWMRKDAEDEFFCLFFGGELAVSKGFYITRNCALSGHVGLAVEWAQPTDEHVMRNIDDGLIYGMFGLVGAQAAVNIKYNWQIVGGLNYYAEVGNASLTKGENNEETLSVTYSDIFEGRAGANINVGLRIQF
ncbi:MAG: hypothetical protein J6U13_06600 [Salinivirgaceae bacterium]|nr:hypothetical protein [Salinivirgaceae bacterium]